MSTSTQKLLTVREVSQLLGISEKDVLDLAETGKIPAYKLGGVYLRFRQDQVNEYKHKNISHKTATQDYTIKDKAWDFFYFNDFYILAAIFIIVMVFIILKK